MLRTSWGSLCACKSLQKAFEEVFVQESKEDANAEDAKDDKETKEAKDDTESSSSSSADGFGRPDFRFQNLGEGWLGLTFWVTRKVCLS